MMGWLMSRLGASFIHLRLGGVPSLLPIPLHSLQLGLLKKDQAWFRQLSWDQSWQNLIERRSFVVTQHYVSPSEMFVLQQDIVAKNELDNQNVGRPSSKTTTKNRLQRLQSKQLLCSLIPYSVVRKYAFFPFFSGRYHFSPWCGLINLSFLRASPVAIPTNKKKMVGKSFLFINNQSASAYQRASITVLFSYSRHYKVEFPVAKWYAQVCTKLGLGLAHKNLQGAPYHNTDIIIFPQLRRLFKCFLTMMANFVEI